MTAKVCIVGVGETEYCRKPGSGKTDLALLLEASTRAIADAGLAPSDIDGIMPFMRSRPAEEIAANLGCRNLKFAATINMGGAGSVAALITAAAAIDSGMAIPMIPVARKSRRNRNKTKTAKKPPTNN